MVRGKNLLLASVHPDSCPSDNNKSQNHRNKLGIQKEFHICINHATETSNISYQSEIQNSAPVPQNNRAAQ